ncbi:hypothetical protein Bca52824_044167 [Brassica carinata]|uniref:Uncharacterized protein n=1 Tax=Brassica carinata TaxID=52824 RepID=A0A8X7S1G1_BRACI|nr:hypothetical protein Bca52824_044167 [Brassica carinata]
MKNKKPKKSPGKSPPKRPSPAKSSPPPLFDAVDLTVIVASSTDPSSANEVSVIVLESSSASPQSTSATDQEEPASIACKVAPLNPHESATVESSPASPNTSSAVAPVELPIGDDKTAPSSPLPLATADANVGSSSQLASGETETESHSVRDKPAKGVSVDVGALQPPLNVVLQEPGKAIDPPKPDWCAHAKDSTAEHKCV